MCSPVGAGPHNEAMKGLFHLGLGPAKLFFVIISRRSGHGWRGLVFIPTARRRGTVWLPPQTSRRDTFTNLQARHCWSGAVAGQSEKSFFNLVVIDKPQPVSPLIITRDDSYEPDAQHTRIPQRRRLFQGRMSHFPCRCRRNRIWDVKKRVFFEQRRDLWIKSTWPPGGRGGWKQCGGESLYARDRRDEMRSGALRHKMD